MDATHPLSRNRRAPPSIYGEKQHNVLSISEGDSDSSASVVQVTAVSNDVPLTSHIPQHPRMNTSGDAFSNNLKRENESLKAELENLKVIQIKQEGRLSVLQRRKDQAERERFDLKKELNELRIEAKRGSKDENERLRKQIGDLERRLIFKDKDVEEQESYAAIIAADLEELRGQNMNLKKILDEGERGVSSVGRHNMSTNTEEESPMKLSRRRNRGDVGKEAKYFDEDPLFDEVDWDAVEVSATQEAERTDVSEYGVMKEEPPRKRRKKRRNDEGLTRRKKLVQGILADIICSSPAKKLWQPLDGEVDNIDYSHILSTTMRKAMDGLVDVSYVLIALQKLFIYYFEQKSFDKEVSVLQIIFRLLGSFFGSENEETNWNETFVSSLFGFLLNVDDKRAGLYCTDVLLELTNWNIPRRMISVNMKEKWSFLFKKWFPYLLKKDTSLSVQYDEFQLSLLSLLGKILEDPECSVECDACSTLSDSIQNLCSICYEPSKRLGSREYAFGLRMIIVQMLLGITYSRGMDTLLEIAPHFPVHIILLMRQLTDEHQEEANSDESDRRYDTTNIITSCVALLRAVGERKHFSNFAECVKYDFFSALSCLQSDSHFRTFENLQNEVSALISLYKNPHS